MNVFVLGTGRCGSTTFIRACQHITNYTSAHESRVARVGDQRLAYDDNHIEADNRLSWFLGRLDRRYGDKAFYVHLKRDRDQTANSYSHRFFPGGIMLAYSFGIYMAVPTTVSKLDVSKDYVDTVDANIEMFLADKAKKMLFRLENAKEHFREFWGRIHAEGDLDLALNEWKVRHNASPPRHVGAS